MRHGAADALELLGPHGWYFRLDPSGMVNVWPCGPDWSWIRMSRSTRDPLLVRGNAVEITRRRDALMVQRNRWRADETPVMIARLALTGSCWQP